MSKNTVLKRDASIKQHDASKKIWYGPSWMQVTHTHTLSHFCENYCERQTLVYLCNFWIRIFKFFVLGAIVGQLYGIKALKLLFLYTVTRKSFPRGGSCGCTWRKLKWNLAFQVCYRYLPVLAVFRIRLFFRIELFLWVRIGQKYGSDPENPDPWKNVQEL